MPSITHVAAREENQPQEPHQAFGADATTFDQGITNIAHERGPDVLLSQELPTILRQLVKLDGLEETARRLAGHWSLDPAAVQGNIERFLNGHPE